MCEQSYLWVGFSSWTIVVCDKLLFSWVVWPLPCVKRVELFLVDVFECRNIDCHSDFQKGDVVFVLVLQTRVVEVSCNMIFKTGPTNPFFFFIFCRSALLFISIKISVFLLGLLGMGVFFLFFVNLDYSSRFKVLPLLFTSPDLHLVLTVTYGPSNPSPTTLQDRNLSSLLTC